MDLKKVRRKNMCKILAFTNASKIDLKHIDSIREIICRYDNDGFGYAISHKDSSVFIEKTLETKSKKRKRKKQFKLSGTSQLSLSHGELRTDLSQAIFHGRLSTNSVNIDCTHPFRLESGGALIHNGVVYDEGYLDNLKTDCDTEILLTYWDIGGIDEIQANTSGYAAIAVLDGGKLHIARDNRATLFCAWSQVIESFVIATTIDILDEIDKLMGLELTDFNKVNDNTHLIFDGNSLVEVKEFHLVERYARYDEKAAKALGELNDDDLPTDETYEGFRLVK
jgi:hypothetical protein